MRILHTSDWHLGKNLEGFSRIEEQIKFCSDFVQLVRKENIDLLLIAGDVFDTSNPSAQAEKLFYKTLNELCDNGKRCVFVIAGNHDNPDRLEAIRPLVEESGAIILGYPKSKANIGNYSSFSIIEAKEGFTKLKFGTEIVNIASLPYPSEKRLNDIYYNFADDVDIKKTYSEKIGKIFEILEENFVENQINIALSHIFVIGSEISDSERRIELGGSLLVDKKDLPKKSDYTALGHIHKGQCMSKTYNAYYSGSPIQYSKNERNTVKFVNIIDTIKHGKLKIDQLYLKNYKPIMLFNCESIDQALDICKEKQDDDIFAYFRIKTQDLIDAEDIRNMKKLMKNIVEIRPIIQNESFDSDKQIIEINKSNISKYFIDFYRNTNDGANPNEDIVKLFNELLEDIEEE
ncbi:metallophosphoesterase family protein [Peptostreptococcus equinus]|uniref:Nuclease SbcCD subunit D n=1 Tax=Peptostreptococcus equinus TaxID=3003601 RepID=A0ABY7JNA3_9FIRM|nr:exonuclease subunit SbcD [Peptostreptococcus sp. CBA3647]WAW14331.1 exonuclease subunit SbcD [Peptostreptococcus sp. CBA3647]